MDFSSTTENSHVTHRYSVHVNDTGAARYGALKVRGHLPSYCCLVNPARSCHEALYSLTSSSI